MSTKFHIQDVVEFKPANRKPGDAIIAVGEILSFKNVGTGDDAYQLCNIDVQGTRVADVDSRGIRIHKPLEF